MFKTAVLTKFVTKLASYKTFETYLPECLFSNCSTSDNKILFASCFCSSPPIQEPTLITLILAR